MSRPKRITPTIAARRLRVSSQAFLRLCARWKMPRYPARRPGNRCFDVDERDVEALRQRLEFITESARKLLQAKPARVEDHLATYVYDLGAAPHREFPSALDRYDPS